MNGVRSGSTGQPVLRGDAGCVRVHGHAFALGSLRTDIFNDRVWPDLFRLAGKEGPHLDLTEMEPERSVTVGGDCA